MGVLVEKTRTSPFSIENRCNLIFQTVLHEKTFVWLLILKKKRCKVKLEERRLLFDAFHLNLMKPVESIKKHLKKKKKKKKK